MPCKSCQSERQSNFNGELAVHFRGLKGLDKPIVWVFPTMVPDRYPACGWQRRCRKSSKNAANMAKA
jgi:hypothetical protein